jgi:hypothetical protein
LFYKNNLNSFIEICANIPSEKDRYFVENKRRFLVPLPLILLAFGAAAAGAAGIKKTYQAYHKNSEAKELITKAHHIFNQGKEELAKVREETQAVLESLGRLKLDMWDRQLGRFVSIFSQLRNVDLTGETVTGEQAPKIITPNELAQIKDISLRASEIAKGGALAGGACALAWVASYGGALTLASASTGTAISALTGAAATNATMAWFGGGSLAAGGMGMAGGMVVLGGICLAPALLVGGMLYGAKAKTNYANAQSTLSQARKEEEEMNCAKSTLHAIRKVAHEFQYVIREIDGLMTTALDKLEWGTGFGIDFSHYKEPQRELVHLTVNFAQMMKLLLETPFLKPDGALDQYYKPALQQGYEFLRLYKEEESEEPADE